MANRFSRPVEFFKTAGLIGGGSVTLAIVLFFITAAEHYWDHSVKAAIFGGLGIAAFCGGAYIAWTKEREKYEAEVRKNENPDFKVQLGDVLTVYSERNTTIVCASVVVTNRGCSSSMTHWKARFTSPLIDVTIGHSNFASEIYEWPLTTGQTLILKRSDMLPARTLSTIQRGQTVHGRILFEFAGDIRPELSNCVGRLWIGGLDFKEVLYQDLFQGYPIATINIFPDEEVRQPQPLLDLGAWTGMLDSPKQQ